MFLFISVTQKQEEIPWDQDIVVHDHCGRYGRYKPFYIANVFSLFFIPIFKWHRQYYVQMSCCGEIYGLTEAVGDAIRKGKKTRLEPSDLIDLNNYSNIDKIPCPNCGYLCELDDIYCSQCGTKLINR